MRLVAFITQTIGDRPDSRPPPRPTLVRRRPDSPVSTQPGNRRPRGATRRAIVSAGTPPPVGRSALARVAIAPYTRLTLTEIPILC